MVTSHINRVDSAEVVLNNVPIPVMGPINFEVTNLYGRKIHQGDPGPNDHPIDSTISQESHQGGIGTLVYRGDDDRGNCWFSTAWMQTSRQLSLPPKTSSQQVVGQETAYVYPHDKLSGVMHGTFGTNLLKWNESTDLWEQYGSPKTIASAAVNSGVTWGDQNTARALYIPYGTGYAKFDGTTVTAGVMVTGVGPKSLVVWEEKLFGMDDTGAVYYTTDGVTGTWTLKGKMPLELTPQNLFVWFDRDTEPAVHLSSSGRVFGLDYLNSLIIETPLFFPDHPTQGLGAEMWRGDAYISAGVGIHRQSNGLIQPVGPDGRDGLPEEFASGYFRHLAGGYNELYGTIVGDSIAFTPADETDDVGIGIPELMISQDSQKYGMLLSYNGFGWHPRWVSTVEPTTIRIVSVDGVYRIFWGSKGYMFWQELPRGYYNPNFSTASIPLERKASHITPFYNWGMVDSPKIMKYFEFKTKGCTYTLDPVTDLHIPVDYLEVYYRIDDDVMWTPLRTAADGNAVDTNGQQRILMGFDTLLDITYHKGIEHEQIQFRFDFVGNPASNLSTPVIQWYTLVGRKWMRTVRVFTFQVDATNTNKGTDVLSLSEHIYQTARTKGGVPLVIGDRFYVVDVTTDTGNTEAGMSHAAYHNVTCVEFVEEDNA